MRHLDITQNDLKKWFGDWGNIDDYWLGYPPATNSFMSDNTGWSSAENVLRLMRTREIEMWDKEDSATEALMRVGSSGGGLTGVEGLYHDVLAGVVASGKRALDEQSNIDRLVANRN